MKTSGTKFHLNIRSILVFFCWSVIFGMVYTQSPLFTSNQNQYFLHGYAEAGVGYLHRDWLANTHDPTPVFSILVTLTIRLLKSSVFFYFEYAILLGIYLFSMVGIVDLLFRIRESKIKFLVFISLFLLIHSAAMRYLLTILAGSEWTYLLEGGVAGQRLLGLVFQPSVFGIFLILSIYLYLSGKGYQAIFAMIIAVVFHPTYLLSAGILTLAYVWLIYHEFRDLKKVFIFGGLALLLVLPVVIYTYRIFGPTSGDILAQARKVLVQNRIPHHAVIADWFNSSVVIQVLLICGALFVVRRSKLFTILGISAGVTLILTILQSIIQSNTLALLFPWRITVILVPLSSTILVAGLVSSQPFNRFFQLEQITAGVHSSSLSWGGAFIGLNLLGISLLVLIGATRCVLDFSRKANSPEHALMDYVAQTKSADDQYLIPLGMEDFRLATGAPVYVDFKSIPYQDVEVLEWNRRVSLAGRFYRRVKGYCQLLIPLAADNGITRVVLGSDDPVDDCPLLRKEYADSNYSLYRVVIP
jgi:hypothetical protein